MDLDRLYIPTTLKSRVNLDCNEVRDNIDKKLEKKIKDRFHGKCISTGYIKKGSIQLISKSRGIIRPSHFTGQVTFEVMYKALVYIPTVNSIVKAQVKNNNKAGMLAMTDPLQIIVARHGNFNTDPKVFDQYRIGDIVNIRILKFKLESNHIFAVGKLENLVLEYNKTYLLPDLNGLELLNNLKINLISSQNPPIPNKIYGNPEPVNKIKSEIDQYNIKPNCIWVRYIRYFINPYELLANHKYNEEVVVKFKHIWDKESNKWIPTGNDTGINYKPFSRAYYELREILFDFPHAGSLKGESSLLDKWRLESINVLNLAEGPGGFIHCLIDIRGTNEQSLEDQYLGITLKKPFPKSRVKDWGCNLEDLKSEKTSEAISREYFDIIRKERGEDKIITTYGPTDTSDGDITNQEIVQYLVEKYNYWWNLEELDEDQIDMDRDTAHFITADGAIDYSGEYNLQEVNSYKLFYSEILITLATQKTGGTSVIKMYDTYTDVTVQLLMLLNYFYEEVYITKPNTSRPANSEKYIVCQDFKGFDTPEIKKNFINKLIAGLVKWNSLDRKAAETEEEEVKETEEVKEEEEEEVKEEEVKEETEEEPKNKGRIYIQSIFDTLIPDDLTETIRINNERFVSRQISKISEGLELIRSKRIADPNVQINIKTNQKPIAFQWCQEYLGDNSCNTGIKISSRDIGKLIDKEEQKTKKVKISKKKVNK